MPDNLKFLRLDKSPIRFSGHTKCPKCNTEKILVKSLEGGFVTNNCPICKHRMKQAMIKKNYGYKCNECETEFLLADLLPKYDSI